MRFSDLPYISVRLGVEHLIFDGERGVQIPQKISSILFYFASLSRIENISIIRRGDKKYNK